MKKAVCIGPAKILWTFLIFKSLTSTGSFWSTLVSLNPNLSQAESPHTYIFPVLPLAIEWLNPAFISTIISLLSLNLTKVGTETIFSNPQHWLSELSPKQ